MTEFELGLENCAKLRGNLENLITQGYRLKSALAAIDGVEQALQNQKNKGFVNQLKAVKNITPEQWTKIAAILGTENLADDSVPIKKAARKKRVAKK